MLVFASPVFYIYYRVLKPTISETPLTFNGEEFFGKILSAAFLTIATWFIYGVACLLASPLRDMSAEEPWKPSEGFQIGVSKDTQKDGQKTDESGR
ncbi:MAG: hypothetical protein CEE38_17485 [Planctomycetes bacterium B3_Pla]|nr:MAG: hypothetical protein CEE38_17485 [Planctomycetes bacterium B3_Pla]